MEQYFSTRLVTVLSLRGANQGCVRDRVSNLWTPPIHSSHPIHSTHLTDLGLLFLVSDLLGHVWGLYLAVLVGFLECFFVWLAFGLY